MRQTPWSLDDLKILTGTYANSSSAIIAKTLSRDIRHVYQKAAQMGLRKSAVFFASNKAGRIQRGRTHPAMRANQFKSGHKTWNTGMKGWAAPGTEATRFKPGTVPPNRQQVGALRINSEGQLDIKLYDGLRAWVQLHHYNWFLTHGEWPARGSVLRFKDSDPHNPAIENLELITRRENMRLNSVHTIYPPEIARLVLLKGALNRQINKRTKEHHESH